MSIYVRCEICGRVYISTSHSACPWIERHGLEGVPGAEIQNPSGSKADVVNRDSADFEKVVTSGKDGGVQPIPAIKTGEELQGSDSILRAIEANTRKTKHAVRAFVLFLFYQLGFTTTGVFVYNIGNPNVYQCLVHQQQCEPNWGWQILGSVIIVIGMVVSSRVGWAEIRKSD